MQVQPVAATEARVQRPLELRVLLRDRLLEDVPEGDAEALRGSERAGHQNATTRIAVTTAFAVATGNRNFQPKRIN